MSKSYKDILSKKPIIGQGGGGGSPRSSKMYPPDLTNAKESYSLSKSLDLLSEGPIEGIVDRDGRVLQNEYINKNFNDEDTKQNTIVGFALRNWGDKELNKTYIDKGTTGGLSKGSIENVKILLVLDQSNSFLSDSGPVADAIDDFFAILRAGPYKNAEFAIYGFASSGGNSDVRLSWSSDLNLVADTINNANYDGNIENGNQAVIEAVSLYPNADEVILMTDEIGDDPELKGGALSAITSKKLRLHLFGPNLSEANYRSNYFTSVQGSGGYASLVSDPVQAFREIMEFIVQNIKVRNNFTTFEGAKYGMDKSTDIFNLYFDSVNWVISNFSRNKIYWTGTPVIGVDGSIGLPTSWNAVEANGVAGDIINLEDYTIDRGIYFNETPAKGTRAPNYANYEFDFRNGEESQSVTTILDKTVKLYQNNYDIKGEFAAEGGNAQDGTGNQDIRESNRDFAEWQNYAPALENALPFLHEITDENVDELDITISVQQLNDTQSQSSKGDAKRGRATLGRLRPTTVTIRLRTVEHKTSGRTITEVPSFNINNTDGKGFNVSSGQIAITGIVTSPYEFTIKNVKLPTVADDTVFREIYVEKVEKETLSSLINRRVQVRSVAERNKFTYSYPFSALVASQLDARSITSIPNRTFMVKGKKVLVPSNYFPTDDMGFDRRFSPDGSTANELIYDGPWDGTFRLAWTDNPAWILYDLLTSYRYGTAVFNREVDKINIWSLYEISRYCDAVNSEGRFVGLSDGRGGLEPRFTLNQILKEDREAFDVIKEIAKTMRALAFYENSQIQFRVDKPEEPVMFFNNLNVRDGIFNYSDTYKSSRTTAIEVTFLDRANNYRPRSEYVEDEQAIQQYGYTKQIVEGFGITSRAAARRAGRTALFESNNATESISFQIGLEGLFLQPGDIIKVDDELKTLQQNFGKFLGISGYNYYDNGVGPTALVVDKSFASLTGLMEAGAEVYVYTPRGITGSRELYEKKEEIEFLTSGDNFISDVEISGLRKPQISKLKLDTGANYIEEFEDFLVFNLDLNQEWPKDGINFSPNSALSVPISGRSERFYRILNVEENEEKFYEVGGIIHHTGKYAYIEEDLPFDPNLDKFEPGFKSNLVERPDAPSGVIVQKGDLTSNDDNTINMPIDISPVASLNEQDKYRIILRQPNGLENEVPFIIDNTGGNTSPTRFVFSGDNALKQVGTGYIVQVFTQRGNFISSNGVTDTFELTFGDFSLNPSLDTLVFYEDISLDTSFPLDLFESGAGEGSGQNSYPNDTSLAAAFEVKLIDLFGDDALASEQNYTIEQKLDLYEDTTLIKNDWLTFGNDSRLEITLDDLYSGFGYTGDGMFILRDTFSFEVGDTGPLSFSSGVMSGILYGPFEGSPAVFVTNFFDNSNNRVDMKPVAIQKVGDNGFNILSYTKTGQEYRYMAANTGDFLVSGNRAEIKIIEKTGSESQRVDFALPFPTVPEVFVQCQESVFPVQSFITSVDESGFSFNAINSNLFKTTGKFAFLAMEELDFNPLRDQGSLVINFDNRGSGNMTYGSGQAQINNKTSVNDNFNTIQYYASEAENITFSPFEHSSSIINLDVQKLSAGHYTGIEITSTNGFIFETTTAHNDIGIEDFSIFFTNQVTNDSNTKRQILHKFDGGVGFELYENDGDVILHMNDGVDSASGVVIENYNSGLNEGEKNQFNILVNRDSGVRSYINGEENVFSTGFTGVQGSLSNTGNLNVLGITGSSIGFTGASFFNFLGYTKDLMTYEEVVAMQDGILTLAELDNSGAALDFRFFDTGVIVDIYNNSNTITFSNVSDSILVDDADFLTGSGKFSFFEIRASETFTGTLIEPNTNVEHFVKVADAPDFNSGVAFIELFDFLFTGASIGSVFSAEGRMKAATNNQYAVVGWPLYDFPSNTSLGLVHIYDLENQQLVAEFSGSAANDKFGYNVAMNNQNDIFIAEPYNDVSGSNAGRIRYYTGDGSGNWNLNFDIYGSGTSNDEIGEDSVVCSENFVATSSSYINESVFVYKLSGASREPIEFGRIEKRPDESSGIFIDGSFYDIDVGSDFGEVLAINDEFLLIGNHSDSIDTPPFGSPVGKGVVYVYSLTGSEPEYKYAFSALSDDTDMSFGEDSMDINSSNLAVISANDSNPTGPINGTAYVYQIENTGASLVKMLTGLNDGGFTQVSINDENQVAANVSNSSFGTSGGLIIYDGNRDWSLLQSLPAPFDGTSYALEAVNISNDYIITVDDNYDDGSYEGFFVVYKKGRNQ